MKFKLLYGTHSDLGPSDEAKTYTTHPGKRPAIVESELDLCAMFPNKSKRVRDEIPETPSFAGKAPAEKSLPAAVIPPKKAKAPQVDPPLKPEKSGKKKKSKDAPSLPVGKEVTNDFPSAKEADLMVFKDGKEFNVHDTSKKNKKVNPKPLRRKEVESFVDEYVGGDEE